LVQEDYAVFNSQKGVFAIADGFGGAQVGDEVARLCCESVQEFLELEAGDSDATLPFELRKYYSLTGNILFNGLVHANRKAMTFNEGRGNSRKGGASVLGGSYKQGLLALANVGSTGAWLFREHQMPKQVITPRNYARLWDVFHEDDPHKQAPLMALGLVDHLEPELVEVRVRSGDLLVAHTDGLSGSGWQEALAEIQVAWGESPESFLDHATQVLESRRFDDNTTILLNLF